MQVNAETNSTRVTRKKGMKKSTKNKEQFQLKEGKEKRAVVRGVFFLWKTRTGKSGVKIPLRSQIRFFTLGGYGEKRKFTAMSLRLRRLAADGAGALLLLMLARAASTLAFTSRRR